MGFLFKSKLDVARAETRRNQAAAADPSASAWVSANAGTGKTHVLTMRVLRLLLGGTPPERILALTYTKAAAAEMSKRVFARLAEWVTADEASLKRKLVELLDRAPTSAELQWARQLFAIAIETPGGLKVQTIHAFCERLLQRFPLEAGVPPGFVILDEHERDALLRQATDEMLAEATGAKRRPAGDRRCRRLSPTPSTKDSTASCSRPLPTATGRCGRSARKRWPPSRRDCARPSACAPGSPARRLSPSCLILAPKSFCPCWRRRCAPAASATRIRRNICNWRSPPARPAVASKRSLVSSSRARGRARTSPRRKWRTPVAISSSSRKARRRGSSPCTASTRD